MTDGSSSNSVLDEEAMTASLSPSLDGDGSGSAVAGHGKQSGRLPSRGEDGNVVVRRDEVEWGSFHDAHAWDKGTGPRGMAATGGVWSPAHHHTWVV
jgi:hypothetical protein